MKTTDAVSVIHKGICTHAFARPMFETDNSRPPKLLGMPDLPRDPCGDRTAAQLLFFPAPVE